jgi:uncharacterized protein
MLNTMRGALASLLGPSNNDQFAKLLKRLSETTIACVKHFRETGGQDVKGVIDFEHKADAIVDEIHELLDNSFIMRFDIPDTMRLTDNLDDVVDGMRKVVLHIDAYKPLVTEMRPEVIELMALAETMVLDVDKLIAMLAEPKLSLARVRVVADKIDKAESHADQLVSDYERKLVAQYSGAGANTLGFIAWHQLFHLLEQMTDDANHVAKMIVSLARKEA